MDNLEVALPVAVLALAFLLKLLIDRSATTPVVVKAVYELPVDMAFLSTSFVVAYAISSPANATAGLLGFLMFMVASILIVLMWRRSVQFFEEDKVPQSAALATVNFLVSLIALVTSVNLISGANGAT